MSILHPIFLILLLPLAILFWREREDLTSKVHFIILMLLILALVRPIITQEEVESKIEGHDIIIALDVSFSMNATDLSPSRYEFAKETIFSFLKLNPHNNLMLIAFTTNPLLLSPPTTDHQLIAVALKSLNPKSILTKGTSLERLFEKIVTLDTGHKDVILMSDGGEESDIHPLLKLLNGSDISLHILPMGTEKGSIIPMDDGTLLKDKKGNLVISRVNPMLKSLSRKIGGDYLEVKSTPKQTAELLNNSIDGEKRVIRKREYNYIELYQFPLGIAIVLFMMLHTRARETLKFYGYS